MKYCTSAPSFRCLQVAVLLSGVLCPVCSHTFPMLLCRSSQIAACSRPWGGRMAIIQRNFGGLLKREIKSLRWQAMGRIEREGIFCLGSKCFTLQDQLQQAQPSSARLQQTLQQPASSVYFGFSPCPGFHSIRVLPALKYIPVTLATPWWSRRYWSRCSVEVLGCDSAGLSAGCGVEL